MADLTTLAAVKTYLGITNATQDTLISTLITRASGQVSKYCARQFPGQTFTNRKLSGTGTRRLTLPGNPIISVSSLQVGAAVITASADGIVQPGYAFDEFTLYLVGTANGGLDRFPLGFNNIMCSFVSGYQTSESDFVPSGNTPVITPITEGNAASSVGVVYTANGVALTQVGNAPAVGQFSFNAPSYTFNALDYNQQVTMTYGYVPQNVEQAVIELVGLKLKQRTNIGVKSQGLAAENVVYEDRDMTPSIIRMLQPYRLQVYS